MKINRSAITYPPADPSPGAVINGVLINTADRVARSNHRKACIRFEVGASPLTGDPSRKGGSRVYVMLQRKRGDLKFLPVEDDDGNLIGVEIAASGDDAGIALAAALREIVEKLQLDM